MNNRITSTTRRTGQLGVLLLAAATLILPNNLSHTALCCIVTEPDKFRFPARLQHCFTLFMV